MTARAAHRAADTGAPLLNLLIPGLGQLYQLRTEAGIHFLVHSALLSWLFFALPSQRVVIWVAMIALAAWSVMDAVRVGRVAAEQLAAAS